MKVWTFCLLALGASVVHRNLPARAGGRPADEVATKAEKTALARPVVGALDPTARMQAPTRSGGNVTQKGWWAAASGKLGIRRHHSNFRARNVVALEIPQLGAEIGAVHTRTEGQKARGLRFIGAAVDDMVKRGSGSSLRGNRSSDPELLHANLSRGGSAFGFGSAVARTASRAKDRVVKARDGALDHLRQQVFALQP